MASEQTRDIEWAEATVEGGTLKVALSGKSSKAWSRRFQGVLALLQPKDAGWGSIRLSKAGVEVAELQPGAEDELRHLLESLILQANASVEDEQNDQEQDPRAAADQEMTAAFRAFADTDS